MKAIVILVILTFTLCDTAIIQTLPLSDNAEAIKIHPISQKESSQPQRELTQILVEEEGKVPKKKASPPPKQQKKPVDTHTIYLRQIDGMGKDFGLDKKLDKKNVGSYFKKLENKVYTSLKRSLFNQRKYMKNYQSVIRHYKDISEKYNIK